MEAAVDRSRAVLLRAAALVAATAGVAGAHALGAPLPPCPLRALTGLPCPGCGATTAGLAVADLDLPAAVAASPAALLAAGLVVLQPALSPVWERWSRRTRAGLLAGFVAVAEAWQLVRLDVL